MQARTSGKISAVLCGATLVLGGTFAAGATPAGFRVEPYQTGLGTVTAIAFAPDGTLFITEKTGRLTVVPPGLPRKTFANIVVYSNSECGLLGVALDPGYTAYGKDGFVYVFATVSGSEQRIIRFRDAEGVGVDRKDVRSGLPTLGANHDGGSLRVGPDGKFYLAIGDGGSGSQKSQDVTNLFGKVLRLNLDGTAPGDNPDLSAINANYRREIFAYGFRNPFRVVLRPNSSVPEGFQVFVNDVGSSNTVRREEVNLIQPGKNYGWPNVEGVASNPSYVNPLHAYNAEGNCIAGGVFYQGALYPPEYRGNYFFMDYGSNRIFRMVLNGDAPTSTPTTFLQSSGGLIDMAEGPEGALYFTNGSGQISRILYETPGNQRPTAALAATPLAGRAPLTVNLDARDSADPDGTVVRYDWQFGDGPALLNGGPTQEHLYQEDGEYTARLTVTDSSGGTAQATITIQVSSNLPPTVEIVSPPEGAVFDAGAEVAMAGRATDQDGKEIPGTDLTWNVILQHDGHTHPWLEGVAGANGSFNVPIEEIEENWSFRIVLTAVDGAGIRGSASRTVSLNYLPILFHSEPAGLRLTANGISLLTPAEYRSVKGAAVEVGASSPQNPGAGPYLFARWSDGGDASHAVATREALVLTAVYDPDPRAVFIRGDSNRDGGLDVSDAVFSLAALFAGGRYWPCPDAGDSNDDGRLDIADAIAVLFALFGGGRALPPPSVPGFDPTAADPLSCEGESAGG